MNDKVRTLRPRAACVHSTFGAGCPAKVEKIIRNDLFAHRSEAAADHFSGDDAALRRRAEIKAGRMMFAMILFGGAPSEL